MRARPSLPPLLSAMLAVLAAPVPAQDRAAVAAAAELLTDAPDLAGARTGIAVLDPGSGEALLLHDADRGFLTASNMKLISTAVALVTLGRGHTFATRVAAAAPPEDGVVAGDLWLVGSGDPTLGARTSADPMAAMTALAAAVRAAGVRAVRGRVVGDGSCDDGERYGRGWQWDYLEDDYAAPIGGLCFRENHATVVLTGAAQPGAPPAVEIEPDVGELLLEVAARTDLGEAARLRCRREPHGERVRIAGTVPVAERARLQIAVTDPARYAARAFRTALLAAGIEVAGPALPAAAPAVPPAPKDPAVLAELRSEPLAAIVGPLLRESVNLYAEQVWRAAARHAGAGDGSAAAERHALAVLQRLGVPTDGMMLADGSGLSRRNLVQPRQLAALLAAVWRSELREDVVGSLPLAGVDGTLRARFPPGSPCHGRVRAKTGFVGQVVCLSGYLPRPAQAPPLVFAVMVNNFTCPTEAAKAAVDAFLDALAAAAGWDAGAARVQPRDGVTDLPGDAGRDGE